MFSDFSSFLSRLKSGEISIEEVYDHCFAQIQHHEARVNALTTEVDQEIIVTLKEKARELQNTPLMGLPIIVKDSIHTTDHITTDGREEWKEFLPARDATVVERIRNAGGLILAKSNLPAGAMDYQTYNSLFGTTNHPENVDKTPGGSSGGSAAAIALQYAPLALGSDLGGSLRIPASFCGISSLRPTIGSLPVDGHGAIFRTTDRFNFELTVGPMAQDVSGVDYLTRILLNDFSERSLNDSITIGISTQLGEIAVDPQIQTLLSELPERYPEISFREITAEIDMDTVTSTHNRLVNYFTGTDLDPDLLREEQMVIRQQVNAIINEVDAWILPVSPMEVPDHNQDHTRITAAGRDLNYWIAMGYYCWPVSVSGHPVLTLPLGRVSGLPAGMQVVGKRNADLDLIQIGQLLS
ncbi:MAG: amidase [Candidatus Kariarchaeaceae archaeon]